MAVQQWPFEYHGDDLVHFTGDTNMLSLQIGLGTETWC